MAINRRTLLTVLTAGSGLAAMPFVAPAEGSVSDKLPIVTRAERTLEKLRQSGASCVTSLAKLLRL
jgi:hypothetical protein